MTTKIRSVVDLFMKKLLDDGTMAYLASLSIHKIHTYLLISILQMFLYFLHMKLALFIYLNKFLREAATRQYFAYVWHPRLHHQGCPCLLPSHCNKSLLSQVPTT